MVINHILQHMLGVEDYYIIYIYIIYIDIGPSYFCEMSAMVTSWLTNPPRWLCYSL